MVSKTVLFFALLIGLLLPTWGHAQPAMRGEPQHGASSEVLRVAVVGDTGIGDRAYHKGFVAVMEAIKKERPDVLLHLGDFIYQSDWLPEKCDRQFLKEVEETLVEPFRLRIFVPGDNDLPPDLEKPQASGCWPEIDLMDTPFDPIPGTGGANPAAFEGTLTAGNALFAVLNSFPWRDPTPWLKPRVERARKDGLWVVFALHEPAVTTAWFLDKRDTALKQINALGPDLVFSGNQHSYERFHAMGIPRADGVLPVTKPSGPVYRRGQGPIHVISGGGGATIKPFADQQRMVDTTAPKEVFDALAARALMNHFVVLEITGKEIRGKTYRVCAAKGRDDKEDPRWKPDKPMWKKIPLECDGKPDGTTLFDQFEILAE